MNPETIPVIWIATKFNHLFIWSIANLPRKINANPFGSFCAKLLTDNYENITSMAEAKMQTVHITARLHRNC